MASDENKSRETAGDHRKHPDDREKRLAAALRSNLRRRKAQARERTNAGKSAGGEPEQEE